MSSSIFAQGTIAQIGDGSSPDKFTTIGEVTNVTPAALSRDTMDVTSHDSADSTREFIGGLVDGGEVTIECNWIPSETGQEAARDNLVDAGAAVTCRVAFPDYLNSKTCTFDDVGDTITATSHGIYTGVPVKFSTTGSLPSEVTAGTVYWVDRQDANTVTLHSTNAAAVAGTGDIDFSGTGAGTHSMLYGDSVEFEGIVTGYETSAPIDGVVAVSMTVKVTAKPTFGP